MTTQTRPSWEEYACLLAMAASVRSEDPHTKAGAAILAEDGGILATGYNGFMPGQVAPEWINKEERRLDKSALIIHAEVNAFNFVSSTKNPYLIGVTMEPCGECAKLIASKGVKKVAFPMKYHRKNDQFKKVFDFYGVEWKQLDRESLLKLSKTLDVFKMVLEAGMKDNYNNESR